MSPDLDQELRSAFAAGSEFVQPHPWLADRARRGARQRQRRVAGIVATAAVGLLVGAGLTYATRGHSEPATTHRSHSARFRLPDGFEVTELATSGPYLYVLFGQEDVLAAYDRSTGKLIRRVTVPANPSVLVVGPGGLVWVAFYADQSGGPTGIWLLSPDLAEHSSGPAITTSILVPTSRTTAWLPDQYGLYRVSMPEPGGTGLGTYRLEPATSLGVPLNTAPGAWAAAVDGRVAVQVTDGAGLHSHLVIAGQSGVTFGAGPFISTGSSLWAIAGQIAPGGLSAPLVRLDGRLQPDTPAAVLHSALLRQANDVWSDGDTIWVGLGPQTWASGPSLVCFTAGSRIGRITTLPVRGQVYALAATPDSVYVSTVPAGQYGAPGTEVTSYRVPAACR